MKMNIFLRAGVGLFGILFGIAGVALLGLGGYVFYLVFVA